MDNEEEEEKDFDPTGVVENDEDLVDDVLGDEDLELDLNDEIEGDGFSDFTSDEADDNYQDPYNSEGRYDY